MKGCLIHKKLKISSVIFFQRTFGFKNSYLITISLISKLSYCFISESMSLKIWRKNKIIFSKEILFLSITIFLPDLFHLATLSEQNHSFLCKLLTNFFNCKICTDVKSPYFVKKNNIYQIENIFVCISSHPRKFRIMLCGCDFSILLHSGLHSTWQFFLSVRFCVVWKWN